LPTPKETALVVVNTTPIIALSILRQLKLLRDLYQEVAIPPAVEAEILVGGATGVGIRELAAAPWVHTVPLRDPTRADLLVDLDRGEAEVIALAQERSAGLVILDERLARRHAARLGLKLTGTVGVLLRAKRKGLIEQIRPLIEEIQRSGIRLSPTLIAEALTLAGET